MSTTTLTGSDLALDGTNLTDLSYTAMTAGAGNGVVFDFNSVGIIFIKNATGATATITLKVPQSDPDLVSLGVTIPDKTFTIADGKIYALPISNALMDSSRQVTIEADQAVGIALRFNQN